MKSYETMRELNAIELEQISGGAGGANPNPPSGCGSTTTLPDGHHMKICGGTIYIDGMPAGPAK